VNPQVSTPPKTRIAYIGLGLMGLPMSRHLVSLGWDVHGYDVRSEQMDLASAAGVQVHSTPTEAVHGCELVVLNLPTTEAVEAVVFGTHGLIKTMRQPQCIVDFSTISVESGQAFSAKLLAQTGCGWVDAPVSGGPSAAGTGTLTVMAGARADDLPRIQALMRDVAARFTVLGPPGSGLVAKMLNQLMVGCLHAAVTELVVLAEAAGIEADLVPSALAGGHADGVLLQQIYPRMRARDFAPRGYARQLLKDLDMVLAYAKSLQVPTPMASQAQALYRMLARLGHAELDTSALLRLYEPGHDRFAPRPD